MWLVDRHGGDCFFTRSLSLRMWLSSYLDREAHTLEDSWGQSVPHRSYHCPYSTWMLAGSLSPGCSRENIHHYIVKSKWKQIKVWRRIDIITSLFYFFYQLAFLFSFSSHVSFSLPACFLEVVCKLTRDYSGCSAGPDWRPCSGTALQGKSWVSEDRSTNSDTRRWLTC